MAKWTQITIYGLYRYSLTILSTPAPVSVAHGGSSPRNRGSRAEDKEAEDVDELDDESHLVIVEEPSPDPAVQPAQAPSSPRETSDARPQAEQQERSRQQILEEDQRNYHHLLALILAPLITEALQFASAVVSQATRMRRVLEAYQALHVLHYQI
ncbi:unnamed protein product, partial [Heligmosomoides polygyrus]|uniref:NR LBD domain-containing protein n=1 Tax=Heligmosomoides polygyrus TaxID=6339 RepID=A0A183FBX2_HELPZ